MKNRNNEKNSFISFYSITYHKDSAEIKSVTILLSKVVEILRNLGIYRYDIQKSSLFIHIQEGIVSELSEASILDIVEDYIREHFPHQKGNLDMVMEAFYKAKDKIKNIFDRARSKEILTFVADTKTSSFVSYKNGFMVVDAQGWKKTALPAYTYIWKNQIIQRDFKYLPDFEILQKDIAEIENPLFSKAAFGVFARFCFQISGNVERFKSLCSLLGYLMHDFTDTKMKAVVLTDSSISENMEGRTGKTLLGKALGYMRNLCEINGKDFNPKDRNKYDRAEVDTQLLFINDLKKNFPLESLFNDITEGFLVKKLYQNPFTIKTKIMLSSNKTLRIEGGSSLDRIIEFELSAFYSDKWSPKDEFGHWFFSDWNEEEWAKYDNFMLFCLHFFLKNGIISPPTIHLEQRRLLDSTAQEFIDFMDEHTERLAQSTYPQEKMDKRALLSEFVAQNEDFALLKLKTFSKWIETYCQNSPVFKKFYTGYDLNIKSNGKRFIRFIA